MPTIVIADTIFDNPCFNELNPTGLIPVGGRLMSSAPHLDGMLFCPADDVGKDSANLLITRTGKGDWNLARTAVGAETYNVRATLAQMGAFSRIGETYQLGLFGAGQTPGQAAPDKGFQIKDFFAVYKSGVVPLTTATLRLGKTVYSNVPAGGVQVQTDLVAATAVQVANNANYGYQSVAGPAALVFHKDDLALVEVELQVVMAITGTVAIVGVGCHVNFNLN